MFPLSKIRNWSSHKRLQEQQENIIHVTSVDIFDLHRIVALHKAMGHPLIEFKLPLAVAKLKDQVIGYTLVYYHQNQLEFKTTIINEQTKNNALENDLEDYAERMVNVMFNGNEQEYSRIEQYSEKLVHWLS